MRQLKYYVACTVDRFIAHPDGTHDGFLMEGEHFTDLITTFPETFPAQFRDILGISGENKCFDTVLMGRKTYEVGLKVGIGNPYPQMQRRGSILRIARGEATPTRSVPQEGRRYAIEAMGKDI
jgi:dihydrofolate reductase